MADPLALRWSTLPPHDASESEEYVRARFEDGTCDGQIVGHSLVTHTSKKSYSMRMGGLGLRRALRRAPATHWSSWVDALHMMHQERLSTRNPVNGRMATLCFFFTLLAGDARKAGISRVCVKASPAFGRRRFHTNGMLKSNGESILPWAIPESRQGSDRWEPLLTCENVPCTKCAINAHMRPWTPMENNSTIVASTQEVSNALKNVHERNESVGGRQHVQHVYQSSDHVCIGNRPRIGATTARCKEQFWNGPCAPTL